MNRFFSTCTHAKRKTRASALAFFFLCALSITAQAQVRQSTPESIKLRRVYGALEGSYGVLGEDQFAMAHLKLGLFWETPLPGTDAPGIIRLGAHVPLRFRTVDHAPMQSLGLRDEDWDTGSDLLRVLRHASVRATDRSLRLSIGELANVELGHGTIIWGYHNNISWDRYKLGAHFQINRAHWGVTLMTDEVIDPNLVALRVHLSPSIDALTIGTSFVTDLAAPTVLRLDDAPDVALARDEAFNPIVDVSKRAVWWGLDAQWDFLTDEWMSLFSYLDINWQTTIGAGVHAGLDFGISLGEVRLSQRVELNISHGGYMPRYIGPLYEVDKFWFPRWNQSLALPKLTLANQLDQSFALGWMTHTALAWSVLRAEFFYGQRGGDTQTALMMAQLSSSAANVLHFRVAALRHGADEIWTKQDALVFSEATAELFSFLYLVARYDLMWRLGEGGTYDPTDAAFVGLGARVVFR